MSIKKLFLSGFPTKTLYVYPVPHKSYETSLICFSFVNIVLIFAVGSDYGVFATLATLASLIPGNLCEAKAEVNAVR